jgi:hypothetical protein
MAPGCGNLRASAQTAGVRQIQWTLLMGRPSAAVVGQLQLDPPIDAVGFLRVG